VLRGSGNVYRNLGHDNADVKQFKGLLAAEIIKTLEPERLQVHRAQALQFFGDQILGKLPKKRCSGIPTDLLDLRPC
jgi:hypothetical protein